MALYNYPVGDIPDDLFQLINLGIRNARDHSVGTPDKITMTLKQAEKMLPDDFSRFTACLLGRYKLLTRADLIAIYLTASNGCADGLIASLQEQFGIPFDIQKAVGGLTKKTSAKNKLAFAVDNGGFRTMTPSAVNVRIQSQLYDEGLSPFLALTRHGVKAMTLIARANGKKLSTGDIKFPTEKSAVQIPKWLHERQVGDLIAMTIAGASFTHGGNYKGLKTSCVVDELLTEVPLKFNHAGSDHYYKPDLGLVITYMVANNKGVKKDTIIAWVEHDTTSNDHKAITKKIVNHLLYVQQKGGEPPYLLLTSSSEERMRLTIEPAVREALKQVIGMSYVDYTEKFGKIAFATHNDISRVGMLGKGEAGLWRKWDFKNECFEDKKHTLVSLERVEKPANNHQEVDDIRERAGSSCGLVGYRDEDIEITPASASIGWREEVA